MPRTNLFIFESPIDRASLDWTGAATQLVVNGKPAGKPIAGEDFYRALLRIWLGDKPVQNDLKKSLLGA